MAQGTSHPLTSDDDGIGLHCRNPAVGVFMHRHKCTAAGQGQPWQLALAQLRTSDLPQKRVLLCPAPSVHFVHSLASPHVDTGTQVLSMAISAPLGMCPGGEHNRIACKAMQWVLQSRGLMGCHWHGNAAWSLAMSPGSNKAEVYLDIWQLNVPRRVQHGATATSCASRRSG